MKTNDPNTDQFLVYSKFILGLASFGLPPLTASDVGLSSTKYKQLNEGFELRPLDDLGKKKGKLIPNTNKYSHLYKDGKKLSKTIFREGGLCMGFKDGYCALIKYDIDKKREEGFSFGAHCIINTKGEIVLSAESTCEYPRHIGGHLGGIEKTIYDLRNGNPIFVYDDYIKGKTSIIAEFRYDWDYKKIEGVNLGTGIYKIDFLTCEITKIDDVK